MTNDEVMSESRRVLFLLAAFFFTCFAARLFNPGWADAGARHQAEAFMFFGLICAVAGITRSFGFRLVCIAVWLLGILIVLVTVRGASTVVFWFIFIGLGLIYRMIKYRGVQEEPEVLVEENPLTPLRVSQNISPKGLIFLVVLVISIIIAIPWLERLHADWSQELKQDPHSGQKRNR